MVSIKDSIATEAEMLIPALTDYTRNIFINTETFNGSRWLMLDIYSEDVFNDVKTLIELRMKK